MRLPSCPRLVVFDLDGTLVDSVPDLARAVDGMMTRLGLPPRGEARVRDWVGNGAPRLVRRALVGELDGEPDEALYEQAYPIFLELYAENVSAGSHLYPGVLDGLEHLRAVGVPLACVTNKPARFTESLLRDLGVRDAFGLVVSGDTLPRKKPDPLPLLHAARHFDTAPADALFVGDSRNDVQAARAAGFPVICVSYGYNHGEDIRGAGPDAVIDSIAELADLLPCTA